MPSIASHYVVAKKVSNLLHIDSDNYLLGNILPDIINDKNSHYKIQGKYYLIPDINKFIKSNNYDKELFLGYLTHLLLDKLYLEEYIPKNIKKNNIVDLFVSKMIYNDYTIINYVLVKKYKLNVSKICKILNKYNKDIDVSKKDNNIKYLKSKEKGNTAFINIDNYIDFLDEASISIANKLIRWC